MWPAARFDQTVSHVLDRIAGSGPYLPSVYILRGHRLRCVGARGYHQVLDGMPLGRGVSGTVLATGVPSVIGDVAAHDDFLAAQQNVAAEVCMPLRHGGAVFGVLNVESSRAFTAEEVGMVHAWAASLEEAIAEQGGPPEPNPSQRLGYHSSRIAQAVDEHVVRSSLVDAARDMSAMSTAILVQKGATMSHQVTAALGPLAVGFRQVGERELAEIGEFVQSASACYSHERATNGWLAHPAVAGAGAGSMAVLALAARDTHMGFLLCADPGQIRLDTNDVERLEILAAVGASALLNATSVRTLRQQALRDPLTGLGHRVMFEQDAQRILADRRARPTALLLIDVDHFKEVNDRDGHQAGDRLLHELVARITETLRGEDQIYRIGGDEFAGLVAVNDERDALAVGERIGAAARATGVTVSVGIALLSHARGLEDLPGIIAAADSAMYRVKREGRDGVSLSVPEDSTTFRSP